MRKCWHRAPATNWAPAIVLVVFFVWLTRAWAGGSGFNVIVVINQRSTNSIQLGNYYCEKRGVPPENVFRMTGWAGGRTDWSRASFESCLRDPLLAMVGARGLTNQAEVVLLSMDIPYRVYDMTGYGGKNSTTAALYYGFKFDTAPPLSCLPVECSLPDTSSNSYAFSERPFRDAPPDTAPTNSFLAVMLTDDTLAGAKGILDRALAGDGSFPAQAVYLDKTSDPARNVRFMEFDRAIFDSRVRGHDTLRWLTSNSSAYTNTSLLGLLTGWAVLSVPTNAFVPGAIGDSLTSYAGVLFEGFGQTTLLAFLDGGAAGSYGTVVEPCNYTQKFPHPLDYFYQQRGFNLAEAYYQSLLNPYQGLVAGDPLSAPFAQPATGDWSSLTNGSVLSGVAPLSLNFTAAAPTLPLHQVDLFLDGRFLQTVTNLPPAAGNALAVTLNGFTVNYSATSNASLASTVSGLAAALNAETNSTGVQAYAAGDRLELQSLSATTPGGSVSLSAVAGAGSAAQPTTWLQAARPAFLDTTATGYLGVLVSNIPGPGDWLQLEILKTNGTRVVLSATNPPAGTNLGVLVQSVFNQVNANPALQAPDGVVASDLYKNIGDCGQHFAQFLLYARSPGWPAARVEAAVTASTQLLVLPGGTNRLEDNLADLRPRNHLYAAAGATNLAVAFPFDTAACSDGFHELTAVAYEGSHVRTQARVSRQVRIQNTALAASFATLVGDTTTALEATLQFSVVANTGSVSRIELFSTGGALTNVTGQANAVFAVAGTNLGLGLHPFYAVVSAVDGSQYRTETRWLRLVGPDAPFPVSVAAPPVRLSWPAAAGRRYDVLSATNLAGLFLTRDSFAPSNSAAVWTENDAAAAQRFYRVRATNY
jgi:uncharacterized protein (TIGR03790 family)